MTAMRDLLRIGALGLLTGTLLVMMYHAPVAVIRELQFLACVLAATLMTRSMAGGAGVSALAFGMGFVTVLVVGLGYTMTGAGLDMDSGITNWGLIPLVEETLKLAPVAFVAWMHYRRRGLLPNPSDLLMLGCFAGAGFALAENVALVQANPGVARDMARQYGPHLSGFYLVPGAWGAAGYVGHAAATGFIAGGFGLGQALSRRIGARWWILPVLAGAWILIEHMLVNLYVNSGSSIGLMLGNGAITPWLFVVMVAVILMLDVTRHRAALRQSPSLRWRVRLTRAALLRTKPPVPRSRLTAARMYFSQIQLVNAAAWFAHRRPPQKMETV